MYIYIYIYLVARATVAEEPDIFPAQRALVRLLLHLLLGFALRFRHLFLMPDQVKANRIALCV